jgi:transposase InsO family protein
MERWRGEEVGEDRRAGPKSEPPNKLTRKEREKVLSIANSAEFRDLPPSQIVPKLADRGEYVCSEATMYRVLREAKQLAHRGKAKEPQERRPVERYATRPNQIWSWDITYLRGPIRGTFFYLYMVEDIWSRKIVGFEVHECESMELAAALVERTARRENVRMDQLTLHSDNGGPMRGSTMLATLQRMGILPSFTRPRVCDDNPFSEALFRTLKYRPGFPSAPFGDLDEARRWVGDFVRWYHLEHLHSGIAFVRPVDRHDRKDAAILENRRKVYEAAKRRHPRRWGSRSTRSWSAPQKVCVRGRRTEEESARQFAA